MINKPPFCTSYDDAREAFIDGELQYWDGVMWVDIPVGSTPFFSRRIEEYRRKPEVDDHNFFVSVKDSRGTLVVRGFATARQVVDHIWREKMTDVEVFKRVRFTSLSISEIEKTLENA
jgi:hypothetical protein